MSNPQPSRPALGRTGIFAVVIVGIVVVCIVVFVIGAIARGGTKPTVAPTPTSSEPASSSSGETAADKSVCGLPGFASSGTLAAAPTTKWVLVGTVAAPTERATAGPGVVKSDGFRSCYAHTPQGALFSAANLLALDSDQSLLKEVAENLIAPGPGQAALVAQAATPNDSSVRYQVAGFKVDSYSASKATIDLAVNASTGALVSFPIQLVWSSGDWKAVTTDTGGFPLEPAAIQNLGGYVPWAGA